MFHNRVLRRIFGPKKEEVLGGWRKLHNEELHYLLLLLSPPPSQMEQTTHMYEILVKNLDGEQPLRRPRH
jgi:hypothetical protein